MQIVQKSLDGNMNKEGGWWHQVPHVIHKIYMSITCKEANWIINYVTNLTPPKEASWLIISTHSSKWWAPLLTCLAILFKGNVCYPSVSNNTCFRLDDMQQMGLEGNTTVGWEGVASNTINPSLWPQSHYWQCNYSLSPITDSNTRASVPLTVLLVESQCHCWHYY
jgi:hypothetical protein